MGQLLCPISNQNREYPEFHYSIYENPFNDTSVRPQNIMGYSTISSSQMELSSESDGKIKKLYQKLKTSIQRNDIPLSTKKHTAEKYKYMDDSIDDVFKKLSWLSYSYLQKYENYIESTDPKSIYDTYCLILSYNINYYLEQPKCVKPDFYSDVYIHCAKYWHIDCADKRCESVCKHNISIGNKLIMDYNIAQSQTDHRTSHEY